MPRVAVVFLGGTISMTADATAGGNVPRLSGADLVATVPGLDAIAEIVAIDLARTPASHFALDALLEIGRVIDEQQSKPDIDGVVVVQGTDSMEETAFLWDLVLERDAPVVVTGAMRAASDPGYDGPANLRDAVVAASSAALGGTGVLVTMAGELHPADDVVKTHTSSLTTFRSPNAGPIGTVGGDGVRLLRRRAGRRHVRPVAAAPVRLVTAVVGDDGALVEAAAAGGAAGIVVAATGAGNTSAEMLAAGETAMRNGVTVALASRCIGGRAAPAYAFRGGGATWLRAGALLVGTLTGPKARIALALGLGADLDRPALAELLDPTWR
jgi:L-asparaginase